MLLGELEFIKDGGVGFGYGIKPARGIGVLRVKRGIFDWGVFRYSVC